MEIGRNVMNKLKCNQPYKFLVSNIDDALVYKFVCCLPPALIPPIHIATLYYFWQTFSRRVDKRHCSCSCWDTVFKGPYETGIASYKHFYFNASLNTLKIWATTVFCVITFYESLKRLMTLCFQSYLRYSMLLLFLSAIFSHYYSWWMYINYWNDEFYLQWYHQLFFTITEILSSFLVLQLADNRLSITPRKALSITGIAIVHIVAGSLDQFILNVINGEGHLHQILRDLSFMVPDVLHVFLPIFELIRVRYWAPIYSQVPLTDIKSDFFYMTALVLGGLVLCSIL